MIFKWLRAKNFLSIGSAGIYLEFNKLGQIIVIKGFNYDVSPDSSNGAGKSTIIEIIVYGLFGKLIKGLPHKEAINKKTKKNLEIQLCYEIDGHEYVIHRGRKPDFLKIFKDGVDETVGGMPETQKAIEDLVKLNYDSFINVVCFGEHNSHAFLACDAATKRSIVENLLGLEKYIKYSKIAKESLKEIEADLAVLRKNYESSLEKSDSANARINQLVEKRKSWIATKNQEIVQLKNSLHARSKELNQTDDGQALLLYQQAQDRININKTNMVKLESQRIEMEKLLVDIRKKIEDLQEAKNSHALLVKTKEHDISTKKNEIRIIQGQIAALGKLQPGVKCGACFGIVDQKNYQHLIDHNNLSIKEISFEISSMESDLAPLVKSLQTYTVELTKITDMKKSVDVKQSTITNSLNSTLAAIQKDSQVKEPQSGAKELVLKEQINDLLRRIESKENELENQDPYIDIINQTKSEKSNLDTKIDDYKTKIENGEKIVPYYEFWIHGFGDDGIRAFIIDGILPALNARINYWLQFLIDNKIKLSFDNKFEVVIERNPADGDPFVYNATSGGERRRINLAISQAFAHVMMLSAGTCPSLISLDEVALNVDVPGIHGIYKMICELSKDRQVLVTTHDPNLNDLLNTCDVLNVVKKNGFTELVYS